MQVKLPILFLLMALVSGCVSGSSDGRPPNYVESQLTQSPIPAGSMAIADDEELPGDIGGPE